MDKRILCIGGGELKTRETLEIDGYLAAEAKRLAGSRRACGLFLPTASYDCMPYYNTFHKVYTGLFDVKTDVALVHNREADLQKLRAKLEKADFIYAGGGNTVYMLERWRECGLLPLIREAYERGVILAGLSAGAICWFERMYSDSVTEGEYAVHEGLGWLTGTVSPHYDERAEEFDRVLLSLRASAWGLENNAALEFLNGEPVKSLGSGKVYRLDASSGDRVEKQIF